VSEQGGHEQGGHEQDGVGIADRFQRLWTPHRLSYIKGERDAGCPFCEIPGLPGAQGLVVGRGAAVYAVLNLYPYNPGHLMLVPYRHVAAFEDLEPTELHELGGLTQRAIRALRIVGEPHGFNVGLNLGSVAGAGIAGHLHQHVVPRWGGDANFMPVIGQTKVLPQLLAESQELLAAAWDAC
jgi:ATP adenylyltransferase